MTLVAVPLLSRLRGRVYKRTTSPELFELLDGRDYSADALRAGVASETVSRYGDCGFPREAEEVRQASRARRGR